MAKVNPSLTSENPGGITPETQILRNQLPLVLLLFQHLFQIQLETEVNSSSHNSSLALGKS